MGKLTYITIDCKDAKRLASFWAEALDGYAADEGAIVVKTESGPGIYLQEVPEPKTVKNRVHIDIGTDDLAAEVNRLKAIGANVSEERDEGGNRWTIMADPEGNEFCVTPTT